MAADEACDVAVIGAGLAGLRAADLLVERGVDVRVYEARSRPGGRALSLPVGHGFAVDLGPAWIWPAFQPHVRYLLERFALSTFAQFEQGTFLVEDGEGIRMLHGIERYGDAVRIEGGIGALANALLNALPAGCVEFDAEVTGVDLRQGFQLAFGGGGTRVAQKLVIAVPPMLVSQWRFEPPLSSALLKACRRWPTWMAAHAKYVALYEQPFWRERGHSGAAMSHVGPLVEINDHSAAKGAPFGLFGFVGLPPKLRLGDPEGIKAACRNQLVRLFGPAAGSPTGDFLMDWSGEPFTATEMDFRSGSTHPPYGEPALGDTCFDGRVAFAAAESAVAHGGLIEGALQAAERAVSAITD